MGLLSFLKSIWSKQKPFEKCCDCICTEECWKESGDDCDEPAGLGHWMIQVGLEEQVRQRIACPELGYPASEAKYPTIAAWEEVNGREWGEYLAEIV